MSYDLQNYQMTLYGSMFTFFTYQVNNLIHKEDIILNVGINLTEIIVISDNMLKTWSI